MACSMPGVSVHCLPEFTQVHVHSVDDAIQPSHPLSHAPSPTLNLTHHQGLFQWAGSFHQGARSTGAWASASILPMRIQGCFWLDTSVYCCHPWIIFVVSGFILVSGFCSTNIHTEKDGTVSHVHRNYLVKKILPNITEEIYPSHEIAQRMTQFFHYVYIAESASHLTFILSFFLIICWFFEGVHTHAGLGN